MHYALILVLALTNGSIKTVVIEKYSTLTECTSHVGMQEVCVKYYGSINE